jgi:hypothetical protein
MSYLTKYLPAIRLIQQSLAIVREQVDGIIRDDAAFLNANSAVLRELSTFLQNTSSHVRRNERALELLLTNTIRGLESLQISEEHARQHGQSVIERFRTNLTNLLNQPGPEYAGFQGTNALQAVEQQIAEVNARASSKLHALKCSILPELSSVAGGIVGAVGTGCLAASSVCGPAGCLAVGAGA